MRVLSKAVPSLRFTRRGRKIVEAFVHLNVWYLSSVETVIPRWSQRSFGYGLHSGRVPPLDNRLYSVSAGGASMKGLPYPRLCAALYLA